MGLGVLLAGKREGGGKTQGEAKGSVARLQVATSSSDEFGA